jgi:hypothetical protein
MTYHLVGCSNCSNLWVVDELRYQASATCTRCQTVHATKKLRSLTTADDPDDLHEVRARKLAARSGEAEDYATEDHYRVQAEQADVHLQDALPTDTFEDAAEKHLAKKSRQEEYLQQAAQQHLDRKRRWEELYEERAEAHLDRYYDTVDVEHVEYEPAFAAPAETLRLSPTPPSQRRLDTIVQDTPPAKKQWLGDVAVQLLDPVCRAIRNLAHEYGRPTDQRGTVAAAITAEILPDELVDERVRTMIAKLTSYALALDEPDGDVLEKSPERQERYQQLREDVESELANAGTGHGAIQIGGLHLLAGVIGPLLEAADVELEFVLRLDASAWDECDDRGTREGSLHAITLLADAGETTVVCPPKIEQLLCKRHPEWADCVTERRNPGRRTPDDGADQPAPDEHAIWADLQTMDKRPGKLAILAHLERNDGATVRDMAADPEIDLAASSVRGYVELLADEHGYVEIDRAGTTNTHHLTDAGETAAGMLDDENWPVHPDQTTVIGGFENEFAETGEASPGDVTGTQQSTESTVYGAGGSGRGEDLPAAEAALADTGQAGDAGYVQWLPQLEQGGEPSSWPLHSRILAADRADGVTFNRYPVEQFGDSRVSYLSCLRDRLVVSTQWSGAARTLVRLGTTLLSPKAWGKILTPSALGEDLEHCFDVVDEAVDRLLRRAAQIGWFSRDEENYDDFSDRLRTVCCILLENLGNLDDLDAGERQDLLKDAHGLLMTATAVYHAIGIPITVDLRVPKPELTNDEELVTFLSETVSKQSSYGAHSVYRNNWETDERRRKQAMPREVLPDDPTADLRASWVVSGPHADTYRRDVEAALRRKNEELQDDMTDYDEIELPIEVADANGYAGMRYAVERFLKQKGMMPHGNEDAFRRTVRLFQAYCDSPYDVADAFSSLKSVYRDVELRDVESALASLPASRLLPDKAPSIGKILKVLLEADGGLGRSEIADQAGIHGGTFDRHAETLAALDLIDRVDGTSWTATVLPWYATGSTRSGPEDSPYATTTADQKLGDVVYELLVRLGVDVADAEIHELFGPSGTVDIWGVREAVDPAVAEWLPLVRTLVGDVDESRSDSRIVAIGERPDQATIDETAPAVATDGGDRNDD